MLIRRATWEGPSALYVLSQVRRSLGLVGLILLFRILVLRPLIRPPVGLVGSVAVLLLQFAYQAILLAADLLKLVVVKLAPLFPGLAFQLFPFALDDVPIHLSPLALSPSAGDPSAAACTPHG